MATTGFDRWFLRPQRRDAPALRLICIPYAGGGVGAFHGWAQGLPEFVEPWLLRLPGRDVRLREPPYTDLVELVTAAAVTSSGWLDGPVALFGHSLGAILAFELARQLRGRYGLPVAHLAVSARPAPDRPIGHQGVCRLPDDEFLSALDRRFQAIPPLLKEDAEMRALYLPALRADMTMLETYRYRPEEPLDCPISAFGGTGDPEAGFEELYAWREHTRGGFTTTLFPGGHFYLSPQRDRLLFALRRELSAVLVP